MDTTMIMVTSIIAFIVIGLVAGYIARAVVPGPDPMGIVGTLVLGMVGSFAGGFVVRAFGGDGVGWIGSIIGAIVVLFIYRAVTRNSGKTA